jgi:hypothetical protein
MAALSPSHLPRKLPEMLRCGIHDLSDQANCASLPAERPGNRRGICSMLASLRQHEAQALDLHEDQVSQGMKPGPVLGLPGRGSLGASPEKAPRRGF